MPVFKVLLGAFCLLGLIFTTCRGLSEYALRRSYKPKAEQAYTAGPERRAEGQRLAKLYGCTSCHGEAYQGLEYNDDDILVKNHAPNLTLSAARFTDAELAQAIRQGIQPGTGRALWGMPSPTFRTISDAELAAVLAHLRSFPAKGPPTPEDNPSLKSRWAILKGLWLGDNHKSSDPARAGTQEPAPKLVQTAIRHAPIDPGAEYATGRHIAMTVCSECHGSDLGSDSVEGGPDLIIAGAYDREAFWHLMRTGVPPGRRDLGIMSQTAREDLKVFTDAEIDALHAYLVARAQNSN